MKRLIDQHHRFHNYLRVSLTEKCNYRCHYCMPEEGVQLTPNEKLLSDEQLVRLVKIFNREGVDKLRLTGGEPTVRKGFVDLVKQFNQECTFKSIGVTTNGSVIYRKLEALRESGLTHINFSLDSLVEAKNQFITRRTGGFEQTLKSIEKSLQLGFQAIKVNVVVMNGFNEDEIVDFVEFTRNRDLEVRFIEFMPFDANSWGDKKFYSYEKMLKQIEPIYQLKRLNEEDKQATSKVFQAEGYKGRVGFITSMSNHFCSGCNRVRLTADGNFKMCLFDNREVNLLDLIKLGQSDEQIMDAIFQHIQKKHASHGGLTEILKRDNRSMVRIGG